MPVRALRFESHLAATPAELWAHASTMGGVNAELAPLRMSAPPGLRLGAETPLGRVLFRSVVSLGGLVPLDLHALRLVELREGEGFVEDSTSVLERRWRHERRIEPVPGGARVVDLLTFEPRLLGPVVARIVRRTFERRHAFLRQRFGALG